MVNIFPHVIPVEKLAVTSTNAFCGVEMRLLTPTHNPYKDTREFIVMQMVTGV